ncbi:hypothetical protein KCQ59_15790 [Bacillus australimaris]|uniref:Uncharacterized protein n=1 Tax=Bacillus australimaris TaxID=1326968 RepID=A0ABD4QPP1_9BACI|nr:hypothetical protein [Bacillus australimaris]MBR8691252.1 hypothetical protein [Bacillus australimaris]
MSEQQENRPKRRKEAIENYNISTQVTPEVQKFFKEVMASKEFYEFASHLMYKYKKG